MENLSKQEIDYSNAKDRVEKLKRFYAALAIFIIVFAFYSFRRYYFSGDIPFFNDRNYFPVIFWIWGLILAIKAAKIFFFGKDWERKMMDKELKNNNNGKF